MIFNVKTTGVCQQMPDQITFNFTFVQKKPTYEDAVESIAKTVIGFKNEMTEYTTPENIKTMHYDVERKTKRVEKIRPDGKSDWEYVFSHYESRQIATLNIPYDKVVLFNIIKMISEMGEDSPSTKFNFSLSAPEIARLEDRATELALNLAQKKADAVCKSMHKQYNECVQVDIVDHFETTRVMESDTCFESRCFKSANRMDAEEMASSMEPQDVFVSINVVSKFEIK